MVLPITLPFAGAAAILHIWLAARVSRLRAAHKISIGDGGNEALVRRMRAHANYGESMPIILIVVNQKKNFNHSRSLESLIQSDWPKEQLFRTWW